MDGDEREALISIWSKSVDTQMHFNEMSVKSRQLGLTFVAAVLGVAVVLLGRGDDFARVIELCGFTFRLHVTVVLVLGAILALVAVRGLDLNVYHKMLRGAVTFGEDFEQNYMKKIFDLEKGMTQAVSHFSRFADARKRQTPSGKYEYLGEDERSAEKKIRAFYRNAIISLVVAAAFFAVLTNTTKKIEAYPHPPAGTSAQ
jgi:hypothetical protein